MPTTIEITASAVRLCRFTAGRLAGLESIAVPADADPLDILAKAPWPKSLGKVAVIMHHPDLLVRTMVQPACPPDRLERIVRFELDGARGDDPAPVSVSWHQIKCGGDDQRVMALVAKESLLERVRAGLAVHEGRLAHLVPPGVALYHAWRRQTGGANEDAIIADIGGQHIHLALVRAGELLLIRSQGPGMDPLAKDIAEAQGLPLAEARMLVTRLGQGSPDAHHALIKRHAATISSLLANGVRFAKAQLQLDQYDPKLLYLTGAGAQAFGFADHLRERLQHPVRLLNPFAGILASAASEELDRHATLPSAWSAPLGAITSESYELDALHETRDRRLVFWRTEGALRLAVACAAVLLVCAGIRQEVAISRVSSVVDDLDGNGVGLVPKAEALASELATSESARALATARIAFLDSERRSGRIAIEILNAIAAQQDPDLVPIVIHHGRLLRLGQTLVLELEGSASTARNRTTADVLRAFESSLAKAYPPIASVVALPKPVARDRQEFAYKIVIPDRAATLGNQDSDGKRLSVTATVDAACDPRGAAQVALDRVLGNEDEAKVIVLTSEGVDLGTFAWTRRAGFAAR